MTRLPFIPVFGSLALWLASSVSAQESRALLDAPLVVSPSQRLGTVLDLDGDGYQDAVGWWFSSSNSTRITIYPFLNDRTGALVRAATSWVSLTPNSSTTPGGQCVLQKCDLDHDGRDDFGLLYLGSGPTFACAYASNGTAAPRLVPTYSFPGVRRVVYADFDGDGVCDAAVTRGNTLELYSFAAVPGGDPVGTLRSVEPLPAATDDLFTLDGNGDGLPDLYVNMGGMGRIYPVVDFACGTPVNFPHGVTTMPMPIAGDIDADGDTDLIVFSMTSYVTLRRTGPSSWSQEPEHLGGPATHLVDVDQDGDLDGVCCGGGTTIPSNRGPSTFRVALNNGNGGFAPAFEMPGLGSDRIAGAVDLDHDGDLDLVAGRCVYYSRGGIRRSIMPLLGDLGGLKVNVNDFDGDLDPDFELKYLSVKRNLGDGPGDTVSAFWPPPGAGSTFVTPGFTGDFDGDGDVDLLVQKRTSGVVTLWLLSNDGGGRFYDAGAAGPTGYDFAYALPGMVDSRALKLDVDGDGAIDLVVRDSQLSRTRIHLNDGTGRFLAAPVTIPSVIAAIADLNGDGIQDLVASMPITGVYFGQVGLTFSALTSFGTDGYVSTAAVAVGDLDGDSDLDVAITPYGSFGSRRVELFWNAGVGTFTREVLNDLIVSEVGLHGSPGNTTTVDLDGDGRLDLVCGPSVDYAAAYVLRRRSDNTGFEPAIQQTIYMDSGDGRTVVNGAKFIDVDGDGDLDLVSERLVRNPRWSGLEHGARRQNTTGNPGASGRTPTLGENGPFQVGSTVTLRLTGAAPFASGMLVAGWDHGQSPPFRQGTGPMVAQRVQITSVVPFTTGGDAGFDGSGTWSLTYQVPAYKAGRTYQYRAYVDDASAVDGRSASNVLWITYGY